MKKSSRLLLTGLIFFTISCAQETTEQGGTDILSLPDLELAPVLEITESDEYMMGALNDVLANSDGNIVISDGSAVALYQFTADGELVCQITSQGGGPGEVSQFFQSGMIDNILWATNEFRIMFFHSDQGECYSFSHDIAIQRSDSWPRFAGLISESDFAILKTEPFFAADMQDAEFRSSVVKKSSDGVIQPDTLLDLKHHSGHVQSLNNGEMIVEFGLPYRFSDIFQPVGMNRFILANPREQTVSIIDGNMNELHHFELDLQRIPLSTEEIDKSLDDLRDRISISEAREKFWDYKPPFTKVLFDNDSKIYLRYEYTEATEHYSILNLDGELTGRLMLPQNQMLHSVTGNQLYVINRPPEDLHSVLVYQVD